VPEILGFGTQSETTVPGSGGGYNDRLLFDSEKTRRDAAKRAMDDNQEAMYETASAVLEAKQWDTNFARNSTNNAPIGMLPTRSNTTEHTPERWPAECEGGRDARREADPGRGCRGHAAGRDGCRTRRHRRVLPNARQRRRSNVW